MLKIKVCGLKETENILDISFLKPDYMGFIFYKSSLRYVGDDFDTNALLKIPESINKTGVFVNEKVDKILSLTKRYKFKVVQLHGNETSDFCKILKNEGLIIMKAFGVNENFDFKLVKDYKDSVDYILFDTKTENFGGSGLKFNWNILQQYNDEIPFWLSGGLSNDNLNKVLDINHPNLYGVDLNSKYEIEPGFKNIKLLESAFQMIRPINKI